VASFAAAPPKGGGGETGNRHQKTDGREEAGIVGSGGGKCGCFRIAGFAAK